MWWSRKWLKLYFQFKVFNPHTLFEKCKAYSNANISVILSEKSGNSRYPLKQICDKTAFSYFILFIKQFGSAKTGATMWLKRFIFRLGISICRFLFYVWFLRKRRSKKWNEMSNRFQVRLSRWQFGLEAWEIEKLILKV